MKKLITRVKTLVYGVSATGELVAGPTSTHTIMPEQQIEFNKWATKFNVSFKYNGKMN